MKNSQENRTEAVRRELVSFIKSARLKRGDKLPSQACLRSRLGVGAVTIERALKLFADDGILEIRPKKGVFLLEDNFNGYVGRRIGMVEFRIANYPYGAVLQQSLRTQFVDHACQEIPFIRRNIQKCECDSLDMYDGLARNIARHNLDGILTTSSFDEEARKFFCTRKIPVCSVGTAAWPYGAVVQQEDFCSRAFQLARERGFLHPAVIEACHAELGESDRTIVRYSGTENKIRILVEAEEQLRVNHWIDTLCTTANRELNG